MNLFDKIKSAVCRIRETEDTEPFENELTIGETSAADFENGTFLNSLDELSEADIELNTAAKEAAKLSVTELLRRVIYYGCFAVFLVSCLLLVQNLIAKQRGAEIYDRLEAEFFSTGFSMNLSDAFRPDEGVVKYLASDTESTTLNDMTSIKSGMAAENAGEAKPAEEEEKKHNEELEKMRAGLMSLAQINPDVYGWITVEGTNINYPLVQGEDNDHYLNHAYTGDYLPIGSIFVDFRCEESITRNFNTVIYGHNITTGAMFHDVTKFFKDEYFNGTYIYVYTLDGIYVYEPFSIYKTREDYNYFRTAFSSVEKFVEFAEELRDNSDKAKDVTFGKNDRILTLSTCTNIVQSERYALHARLVKTILD